MNVCVLVGRLTKKPELRYTPGDGKPVATFTIAVNRSYKNKQGKYDADFFTVVVWGKPGENCANFLDKGHRVSVEGELRNRNYEVEGVKRYVTEIIAERVEFLENKNKDKQPPSPQDTGFSALDDDIPF